jgi:acetoacetyl-CoA synthetase
LEKFAGSIDDSLCIGQRRSQDKDERVLLFLKMRPGYKFTSELVADINTSIRKGLSARHVPSYIFEVSDIPVRLSTHLLCNYYRVNVKHLSLSTL